MLQILQVPDDRECENGLTHVLGFDKFDFVKLLMRNRCVVVGGLWFGGFWVGCFQSKKMELIFARLLLLLLPFLVVAGPRSCTVLA